MTDLEIACVEVVAMGPPVDRLSWALDMPGQYMTGIVLRLTTRGGVQGSACAAAYSDHHYDLSVLETLRTLLPSLLGRSVLAREAIWRDLLSKTLPRAPQAQSLIDVALWDAAARAAGLPLWQMLGGARDRIAAYASTPLLDSPDAYVDEVARLREAGFHAIKFHCWCEPERDLAMVRSVAQSGAAGPLALMLDVEQRYDRLSALRVGRELGGLGYRWFEAPLDDHDLHGYRALCEQLEVPIIPGGNSVTDHRLVAFALSHGCWDIARLDVMSCGGFTPALKIMGMADAYGMTVEPQCWGYTLHQAANLALMLGQPNATYFEQPLPFAPFEYGARQVIRPDADGMVHAPLGAGLGIELDWESVMRAGIGSLRIDRRE